MDANVEGIVGARVQRGRLYRPELDVLRFVAFFLVYLSHTIPAEADTSRWQLALSNATAFGVPIFFALSAYLITELLTAEKQKTETVNVRYFYFRRMLRIWPLYFFVLGIGYLGSRLHGFGPPITGHAMAAYALLVGNWYTSHRGYLAAVGPLWSIPVEEQFYLLWPWFVRYCSRRNLAILCTLGWGCSQIVLLGLCSGHAAVEPTIWTNSLVHLQYFALGAGASLFFGGSLPRMGAVNRVAMTGSALLLLFAADYIFDDHNLESISSIGHIYPVFLLGGLATTAILIGFLGWDGLQRWQHVRYLGKISYGLYAYHFPCLVVVSRVFHHMLKGDYPLGVAVTALPATIVIASISYRYLETPFLRLKERYELVPSRKI